MRRLLVVVLAIAALSAHAQQQSIKLVVPTTITVAMRGDTAQVRAFFSTPKPGVWRAYLVSNGGLVAGRDIGFVPDQDPRAMPASSVLIEVHADENRLRRGGSETATLVLTAPGTTDPATFPITITRSALSFTATPTQSDICLGCGEPHQIAIKIANNGTVPIRTLKVGVVEMSDAGRKHRWLLGCDNKTATVERKGIVIEPCSAKSLPLAPSDSTTITIPIDPPKFAGDYATTVELIADDAPAVSASLVVRIRGPYGEFGLPLILFAVLIIVGAGIAYGFEAYFGAGGGQGRTNATIALLAIQEEMKSVWIDPSLALTRERVALDLDFIQRLIASVSTKAPEELRLEVTKYSDRLEKLHRLLKKFEIHPEKAARLDEVPITGTADQYSDALDAAIRATVTEESTQVVDPRAAEQQEQATREALQKHDACMRRLRYVVLGVVSLATAFLALYDGKCSYGTWADYIAAFFWGLGLTQAGNALLAEGKSRYNA